MHHPFHVHGAGRFLVIARDGEVERNLVWKDTVLVRTGEVVDILLDVTNPGRWMAHCHIAEHHESGMMFSFDVLPAASRRRERRGQRRRFTRRRRPRRPRPAFDLVDVVVIGGGQTGLAIGYHLKQQGKRFVILERAAAIAPAWRERWDSLVLFTPRRYDAPARAGFPGEPNTEPNRDEVITYLERYAAQFDLPVELNSEVRSVSRKDGQYVVELADRTLTAEQVVVATGPFQRPRIPASPTGSRPRCGSCIARRIADRTTCRPAGCGRRRRQHGLPDRRGARRLAPGRAGGRLPTEAAAAPDPRPAPLLVALDLRLLRINVDSRPGRRLSTREVLIGSSPRRAEKQFGVQLKPRVVDVGRPDGPVR